MMAEGYFGLSPRSSSVLYITEALLVVLHQSSPHNPITSILQKR